MAETNNKKNRVNPGLVRSESDYKRSKAAMYSNPTKQAASVALPVTEKETKFAEMYAESLKLSWLPMTTEDIVIEVQVPEQPKVKKDTPKYKTKFENVKAEPVKKTEKVKKSEPDEMEILMANAEMVKEAPQVKETFTEHIEIVDLPKPEITQESNVFESINAIPVSPEVKTDSAADRSKLNATKPYMKIDKIEVRKTVNSDGETVYKIGKEIMNSEQFDIYMQGIYGKILSSDCRHIEFEDSTSYKLQRDGFYKDTGGNLISADDLIAILSTK